MGKSWRPGDWPAPLPYVVKEDPPIGESIRELGDPLDWVLCGIVSLALIGVYLAVALWHPDTRVLFQ